MRNRGVGKTQTTEKRLEEKKKRKIPSFLSLFRRRKKSLSFLDPSPFPPLFFSRKLPSTRKKNRKVESLREHPYIPLLEKSLFDNAGHVEGEHARHITFLAKSSLHRIARRMLFLNIATLVSNPNIVPHIVPQSLFPFFFLFSISNYKSVKMFLTGTKKYFSRRHICVWHRCYSPSSCSPYFNSYGILGRFRFTTVLKSGGEGLRWRSSRLVYNFVVPFPPPILVIPSTLRGISSKIY